MESSSLNKSATTYYPHSGELLSPSDLGGHHDLHWPHHDLSNSDFPNTTIYINKTLRDFLECQRDMKRSLEDDFKEMKGNLEVVRGDLDRVRGDLDGMRGNLDGETDVLAEFRDEQKTLAKWVGHLEARWGSLLGGYVCITFFLSNNYNDADVFTIGFIFLFPYRTVLFFWFGL